MIIDNLTLAGMLATAVSIAFVFFNGLLERRDEEASGASGTPASEAG